MLIRLPLVGSRAAVASSQRARSWTLKVMASHTTDTSASSGTSTSIAVHAKQQPRLLEELAATFQLAEGFEDVGMWYDDAAGASAAAPPGGASFQPAAYYAALATRDLGQLLMTAASIPSTQSFLRAHSRRLPDGAILVADQQTQGKGRGGNSWTSPAGCLMFSVVRRVKVAGSQAPFLNYVVCLAVLRGIAAAAKGLLPGDAPPNVRVKWPNDIYSDGAKVGGALIHTTWQGQDFAVITGIGLNVSNTHPTTCLNSVLSQQLQQQQEQQQQQERPAPAAAAAAAACSGGGSAPPPQAVQLSKEALMAHICNALERCFDVFEQQGFGALQQDYLRCWMHTGQQVVLVDPPGTAAGEEGQGQGALGGAPVRLTITGLSQTGFLQAVDAGGAAYELTPDGNSLDMMQGLIRRKL